MNIYGAIRSVRVNSLDLSRAHLYTFTGVCVLRRLLQRADENKTTTAPTPSVKKKIGKTTYIVKVYFSKNATETMRDKIKRMIRTDIQQN